MTGHNNYLNGLIQLRPQYTPGADDRDTPENVTWWKGTFATGLTIGQAAVIQAAFDAAWGAMWAEIGATAVHYAGSVLTDWSSNTGIQTNTVGSFGPVAGTQGNSQPSQVSGLISLLTALRFKGGHGRVYLPNVGVNACTGNMDLSSAVIASVASLYDDIGVAMAGVAGGSGGGFVQQLFRYRNADYPSMPTPVPTLVPVTSIIVQQLLATQRRRLRKVAHR